MSLGNFAHDEQDRERLRNALLLKELTEETLKGMDIWKQRDNSPAQQRAIETALTDPKGREFLNNNPALRERLEEQRNEGVRAAHVAHVNALTELNSQRQEAAARGDAEAVKKLDRDIETLNDNYNKNPAAHPPAADRNGLEPLKNVLGFAATFAGINAIMGGIDGVPGLTNSILNGPNGADMNRAGVQAFAARQEMQGIFSLVQEVAGNSIAGPGMDMGMGMNNTGGMNNIGMSNPLTQSAFRMG